MQAEPLKPIHIFSLGCCALAAQSIFIRELLPLFTGTEFVVGALLAGWLFWIGAGALVGGRVAAGASRHGYRRFLALASALALLLPATVVGIRFGRGLIARPPGTFPPLGIALAFSLLVTAPFGFAYGTVYNVASVVWGERPGGMRRSIARVYLWEAAGSFCGALLFSFVLVVFFSQFQAALVAGMLLALSAAASRGTGARGARGIVAVLAVSFILAAVSPSIDRKSIESVYRGYRIEKFYSSRYGEVVVASQREEESVFSGGGRLFSYPEPERTEETIHIPLLLCPQPRAVLLVGSSLGGGWEEAVKHPSVKLVDCIELDGSLFALGAGGPGPPEVRFLATDGRFFLSRGAHRYDCIILSTPPPVNLQWNRFYTREFFEVARGSLNPGGVFAFTHPSSENFLSGDQEAVLGILKRTLEGVFPHVLVLPGSTAHFVASDRPLDPETIVPRLAERGVDAPFVGRDYLPFRFTGERIADLRSGLDASGSREINTDAKPVLPFRELALEGSKAGSSLTAAFRGIARVPAGAAAAILGVGVLALFGLARRGARGRLAVGSVGFASFLFQLLVLLRYQSFSGLLYRGIVLLTALFMAGAAAGAFLSMRNESRGAWRLRSVHAGFILLATVLAGWGALPGSLGLSYVVGSLAAMAFAWSGGVLTGAYYPIVVRTAYEESSGAAPATFYAWDVFGACVAGITGGIVFFPVLGLAGTALFIAFVHLAALVFLAGRW